MHDLALIGAGCVLVCDMDQQINRVFESLFVVNDCNFSRLFVGVTIYYILSYYPKFKLLESLLNLNIYSNVNILRMSLT